MPFRAGDWKCGNEGCNYHNFAKNTSCLRCGASRHQAAVVAEGGMNNFGGGSNYGSGPPNMNMGSMDNSSYGGMGPASSGYGGNQSMGGPPGGFGGQSFGPPQSNYALPSGIGAPSPYMQGGYSQMASNGMPNQGGFDSRAEQAFNQGNASASAGASAGGYSNGGYGGNQSYGGDVSSDFSFLNTGMRGLDLGGEREGRNGQGGAKSPQ